MAGLRLIFFKYGTETKQKPVPFHEGPKQNSGPLALLCVCLAEIVTRRVTDLKKYELMFLYMNNCTTRYSLKYQTLLIKMNISNTENSK